MSKLIERGGARKGEGLWWCYQSSFFSPASVNLQISMQVAGQSLLGYVPVKEPVTFQSSLSEKEV